MPVNGTKLITPPVGNPGTDYVRLALDCPRVVDLFIKSVGQQGLNNASQPPQVISSAAALFYKGLVDSGVPLDNATLDRFVTLLAVLGESGALPAILAEIHGIPLPSLEQTDQKQPTQAQRTQGTPTTSLSAPQQTSVTVEIPKSSLPGLLGAYYQNIIPSFHAAGRLPLLASFVNRCTTAAEFKAVVDFIETALSLPESRRAALAQALVAGRNDISPRSVEKILAVIGQTALVTGVPREEGETPASFRPSSGGKQAPKPGEARPPENPIGFDPLNLNKLAAMLPPKEAQALKSLVQSGTGPLSPDAIMQIRILAPKLAQAILTLKAPEGTETVEKVLCYANHPDVKIRLLLVNLLKELVMKELFKQPSRPMAGERPDVQEVPNGANIRNVKAIERYRHYLKMIACNRESAKAQAEAIRVLLDMESGREKGRDEMEALLEEIELAPTVRRFLKSRDSSVVLEGLTLLSQAWECLGIEARKEFAGVALEVAERSRSEEVNHAALDLLLTHSRDLEGKVLWRMLQKALYNDMLSVASRKYRGGWTHCAGMN